MDENIKALSDAAQLTDEEGAFLRVFRSLHHKLRAHTKKQHNRINPALEDFFPWKERGAYWTDSGKNITIYNSTTLAGDVSIGDNTWIGPFCALDGTGGLSIGSNCSISSGCQIISHDSVKWSLSGGAHSYEHAPVAIGDCCFLGTYTVVTKGVTIGDHCLIAAGTIVTKDIPSFSIVGGSPGQIIGKVTIKDDQEVELVYHKE